MSLAALRASLALWRRRNTYRSKKLSAAHARNDQTAIAKWTKLRRDAGDMVHRREQQIAAKRQPTARDRIVAVAQQAAANYRKNPTAYHYLAGGVANTVILSPTPANYRSDCSQFAVNVYRLADVKCPGSGTYLYSNTMSIAAGGRIVTTPKPGDLGLYSYSRTNPRGTTHHVEVVVSANPLTFIGHGTPQIDSITPGLPTIYLSFID